ncbi:hypothetical protein BOX15_Mlig019577g1, partial [Macrostomum lignano]
SAMPMKCCLPKCTSNYKSGEKVTVYSFPKDKEDYSMWIRALPPNVKSPSKYMGICQKHWPTNAPMLKVKRFMRPMDPPSVFPNLPTGSLRLTEPKHSRDVQRRGILLNQRAQIADEMDSFNETDRIHSWSSFVEKSATLDFVANEWIVQRDESCVRFVLLWELRVECSISVMSDFSVIANRHNTPVSVSELSTARATAGVTT